MLTKAATLLLLGLIRAYQLVLSPLIGFQCRYHPSCSAYAREAIETFGALRGGMLALRRLLRCHPWGGHGVDPVPDKGVDGRPLAAAPVRPSHP